MGRSAGSGYCTQVVVAGSLGRRAALRYAGASPSLCYARSFLYRNTCIVWTGAAGRHSAMGPPTGPWTHTHLCTGVQPQIKYSFVFVYIYYYRNHHLFQVDVRAGCVAPAGPSPSPAPRVWRTAAPPAPHHTTAREFRPGAWAGRKDLRGAPKHRYVEKAGIS